MGARQLAIVHCAEGIPWHAPFAEKLCTGLSRIGIDSKITSQQCRRNEGFPILLGTSMWKAVEQPPYLLVDRCSFGDTEEYVSLVWNGHGMRGDHKVPEDWDGSRWDQHGVHVTRPEPGNKKVLCGQFELFSPNWATLDHWYSSQPTATHFRPHPAGEESWGRLPICKTWDDVGTAITLNSSVAVDALINGVLNVHVCDAGGMAYGWDSEWSGRLEFLEWLAWTQWSHQEIEHGIPIRHLFQ